MKVFAYKIQPGDTLGSIAYRYTGNKDRWVEMLEINPQIPKQFDEKGQKQFVPRYIQVYGRIFLPASWANGAGYVSGPSSGAVGEPTCPAESVDTNKKPYLYTLQAGDKYMHDIVESFGLDPNGTGALGELRAVNNDLSTFYLVNGTCTFPASFMKSGNKVRIPNSWPDPWAHEAFPKRRAADSIVDPNTGMPYVPPGPGPGPGPGGTPCPDGQEYDTVKKTCVPAGTATKIGATDTSFFKGNAIWWILLAGGAGIGGALLLNQLIKSKKVHVPFVASPPALPAHKEEVVVRK